MRIAGAYSLRGAHAYRLDKLERGLRYIDATPEDETPADVRKVRAACPRRGVVKKPFAKATVGELEPATRRERRADDPFRRVH